MQKRTRLLGTVCVLAAAFVAGPASAASLTDWTGAIATDYMHGTGTGSRSVNEWGLNGSAAGPLGFPNLNLQADGGYTHAWGDHQSQEGEFFGGSLFWGGMDGRFGVNGEYTTLTHAGHITSGGVFGEYYFGPVTVDAKGGWLSTGGTRSVCVATNSHIFSCGSGIGGGHGNYVAGDVTFYALPDLAIQAGIDWADRLTGGGCQVCGRTDINTLTYGGEVEFLMPFFPISIAGTIAYTQLTHGDGHITTWGLRLKWYPGAPSLIDAHRNGTLHGSLTGS